MSTSGSINSRPALLVLAGVTFCLGAGLFMAASAPIQTPVDAGIRYVDMHKVMVNSKFYTQRATRIRDDFKAGMTRYKTLGEEYEKERAALRDMLPGSKEAEAAGEKLLIKEAQMKYIRKMTRTKSSRDTAALENAVYEMARKKIADYARIKGLNAVLEMDEERHKDRKLNLEAATIANQVRGVLWFNPLLDVTDDIIKIMN